MTSKAYVFIDGLEDTPIVCGVIQIDEATKTGRFRYGKSYLNRTDAFALDPVNLPLTEKELSTQFNKGVFGALSDAGERSEYLISEAHKRRSQKQKNEPKLVSSNH